MAAWPPMKPGGWSVSSIGICNQVCNFLDALPWFIEHDVPGECQMFQVKMP